MSNVDHLLVERPDRLQLCPFHELVNRPPAPWAVRGFLRTSSVALLYGRRGCFKSFLALDLAASLATGLPWHGHDIVDPGLVIYIAAEGGGGMVQRSRAWAEEHGIDPSKIRLLFVTEPAIINGDSEDMDVLIHRIREAIDWHDEGWREPDTGFVHEMPTAREWPVMIVIDTLARCFSGDENQQEDMGMFIQGVDRLKMEFNASIFILHHTGRDESHERGSTALGGACDTIYRVDADADTKQLTLTNEKMKDSREPSPIVLACREVQVARRPSDDPNEDLTSIVIESASASTEAKQAEMLSILDEHRSLSYADWLGLTDIPKTTFKRYIVGLRQSGQIVKENDEWRRVLKSEGPRK